MTRTLILLLSLLAIASLCPAQPESGNELLSLLGCRGCHVIGPGGGSMGPSLNDVGRRLTTPELRRWIKEPKQMDPQARMPAYPHLSEEELDRLQQTLQRQP